MVLLTSGRWQLEVWRGCLPAVQEYLTALPDTIAVETVCGHCCFVFVWKDSFCVLFCCISLVARITLPVVWQGQLFTSIKVMWQGQLVRVSESCDGNSFVQVSESCDGDSFVRVLVMCKGDSFVRGSVIWWGQLCRVWEPGDRDSFVSESLARAALC